MKIAIKYLVGKGFLGHEIMNRGIWISNEDNKEAFEPNSKLFINSFMSLQT